MRDTIIGRVVKIAYSERLTELFGNGRIAYTLHIFPSLVNNEPTPDNSVMEIGVYVDAVEGPIDPAPRHIKIVSPVFLKNGQPIGRQDIYCDDDSQSLVAIRSYGFTPKINKKTGKQFSMSDRKTMFWTTKQPLFADCWLPCAQEQAVAAVASSTIKEEEHILNPATI